MNNLYNAKISFKGENSFTFILPDYGELTIYSGKDIYVKGLSVKGVELLRQLRPLLLDHTLNAKPDGCYRVIDIEQENNIVNIYSKPLAQARPVAPTSVADLKASLIKTTGPIVEDEPVIVNNTAKEIGIDFKAKEEFKDDKVIDVVVPKVEVARESKVNNKKGLGKGLSKRKGLAKSKK